MYITVRMTIGDASSIDLYCLERPHIARYPPCTSKVIPAARGGGLTPPAAENTGPSSRLFAAAPPSTLGSYLSGTLEAVVFTAPSSPIHLRRVECWRFTKHL